MRRRDGFSLVELLVVIGIIAVLSAILLPALNRSRRAALRIQCMANMHQLGMGMQIYAQRWKGILPWDGYAEGDRPGRHVGRWSEPSVWFNAAAALGGTKAYVDQQLDDLAGRAPLPKAGDKSMFVCPEATDAVAGAKDDLVTDGYFMLWGQNDAGLLERRKTFMCYGYNTQLDGGIEDRNVDHRVNLVVTHILRPSVTALLIEKLMRPKEYDPPFDSGVGQQQISWKEFTTRHDGGGFILFADNHVGYFKRTELLDPPNAPRDYNQYNKVIWNPRGPSN